MSITPGQLFVVATPIGNLGDLTARAREIFSSVDLVLCEDTRVTAKLMAALELRPSLHSFHEHTDALKRRQFVDMLTEGKKIALVTDAGTPAISDPGSFLVADAVAAGVTVTPIPGPSAVIAALSISGLPLDRFTFVGFPPHKKGRQTFFKELNDIGHTVVLYESTHRIDKTLEALKGLGRQLIVCRELTKLHETIYRGSAEEVMQQIQATSSKGEFVIVIAPE
ncbi:MAG: rRNA (cytidine1402-2-O)-methyltransferase [Patescibacteria group bacterium]|nr:rRNA (cytidine1402-2-O)-methyltransferase [Patescibacteria group bacterium]